MNIKEIRIGNHIFTTGLEGEFPSGTYEVITEAHNRSVTLYDMAEMVRKPKLYIPILLAKEWLNKFGFKGSNDTEYKKGDMFLTYNKRLKIYEVWNDIKFLTSIKYVHQLQNLYHAIKGKELTIKQ